MVDQVRAVSAQAEAEEVAVQPDTEEMAAQAEEVAVRPEAKEMAVRPQAEIVTVRPDTEVMTRQKLPYFVGISEATAGSQGISMNLVIIPAGGAAAPHYHRDYETAIYLLKGEVETRYGEGLSKSIVNRAGDFLFIPPGVPHQPFNLSQTEPAQAIVARNDPNEQENVVPYSLP